MQKITIIIGTLIVALLLLGACAPEGVAPPGEETGPAGGVAPSEEEAVGGVAPPEERQAGGVVPPEEEATGGVVPPEEKPTGVVTPPEEEAEGEPAAPPSPEAVSVDIELEVDSTNPEGAKFVAPESGSYEITIVGGAYCWLPEGHMMWYEYGGWRTRIDLYVNRPVEWGARDEWGLHPINSDNAIGPNQSYPTIAEAEAAGQGLSVVVDLDENDYIIMIVSDGSDYYHDNVGTVELRITGP